MALGYKHERPSKLGSQGDIIHFESKHYVVLNYVAYGRAVVYPSEPWKIITVAFWLTPASCNKSFHQNALPKNFCIPAFNTVDSYNLLVILVIVHYFVVGALNCFVHKPSDGQQVSCLVYVLRSLNRVFINTVDRREILALILSNLCRIKSLGGACANSAANATSTMAIIMHVAKTIVL